MNSHQRDEDAGNNEEHGLCRKHGGGIGAGAAERTGRGAGRGVARDAAEVERELPGPQLFAFAGGESRALMPPHMPTQQPGGKAGDQQGERQRKLAHITLE